MNGQTTDQSEPRIAQVRRHRNGFTLFELLVVIVITMALVAAGLPAFIQWTKRAKLMGFVRATQTRFQVARTEAVKGQFPIVVQPDFATQEILVFANVDLDLGFTFNPDPLQVHKTVDYEIARLNVPTDREIFLWHPGDAAPDGAQAITGFTTTAALEPAAVFLPDGSVDTAGGIHIADARGNFFSVRVEPAATAKVRILKWDDNPSWGTTWDDNDYFFPRGRHPVDDVPMWRWF